MLTERRIRDAKPGPKATVLWDAAVRGFGVKVQPGGTKSYVLSYRVAGRKRLANLARVGEISLRVARERAGAELARIRDGEPDPLDRRREARDAPTVARAVERFLVEYSERRIANGRMTERTRKEYAIQCRAYIVPAIGNRTVESIGRADVERIVDPLRPVQRNRVLALLSRIFTVAEAWEWRPQRSNPARGVERAVEQARDRTLAPGEFAALAAALAERADLNPAAISAIRLAAVTGLRIGEVLAMRWTDIEFETGRLTLPETKTGRRVHDLPGAALDLLAGCARVHGNPWVFASGASAAVTYRTVRQHFAAAARAAGLEDVRIHDLRRSYMTAAAAAGVGTHVLRDLLGHRSAVMADRYVRAVGNPVREAREAMAGEIAGMMAGGTPAKVVPFRARRNE